MTQVIHPITKWTLHSERLDVTIHANTIFDISSCAVLSGNIEKATIPCTTCFTEEEYLEQMRKQGFTVKIN